MALTSPLSVSDNAIKLYNASLSLIGLPTISSFLDNNKQAEVGNALVGDSIEALLAAYPWRFARQHEQLTAVDEDVPYPWTALYAIGTNVLTVRQVFENDVPIQFDVFGRRVATKSNVVQGPTVVAEITDFVGVGAWPGYFRKAASTKLAADVCMPLTQDERLAAMLFQLADRELTLAKTRDAQSRSPSRIDTKRFIRTRRGVSR